jgi:hypothetical protein
MHWTLIELVLYGALTAITILAIAVVFVGRNGRRSTKVR